jgi:hypothetical protein
MSATTPAPGPWTPGRTILLGGLVVGVLDILDAFIFFGLRGVSAQRILHSIAAGLLGRESAIAGGLPTALLGLCLHFIIATGVVATYYLVSRGMPTLRNHPVISGMLYGIVVFFVMQLIVLPLSATTGSGRVLPSGAPLVNALLIHVFGVGLPAALFTTRGLTGSWLPSVTQDGDRGSSR